MRKIIKTRIIKASAAEVFSAFTTVEGLKRFFATDAKVDLVRGGVYEVYFSEDGEYGTRGSEGCRVISFTPSEYFEFTWNVPPQFEEDRAREYRSIVVIQLHEERDQYTHITLTNEYFNDSDNIEGIIQYFEKAWDYVLDALVAAFTNKN